MLRNVCILFFLVTVVWSLPSKRPKDEDCPDDCELPACLCSSTNIPNGLSNTQVPQIVLLTFDDAVTILNYKYYEELFFDKKNPDGCPVSATFFISHEYTDYSLVHELYKRGNEIALHSISHLAQTDYWKQASVDVLKGEFDDQRTMVAHFADIPADHFKGLRIPFLQMPGDNLTKIISDMGLDYDCSWPTRAFVNPGLWPYSMDYHSMQDCTIQPCPSASAPGVWIQPMIDWTDNAEVPCSMVDACVNIPDDVDGLFDFMMRNFNLQYNGNRAPFGFFIHAAWFALSENHYQAYKKFVEHLNTLNDVYIVNIAKSFEYVKNPNPLDQISESWPKCNEPQQKMCRSMACELKKGEEVRYMTTCASYCPRVFPWIGNPLGK